MGRITQKSTIALLFQEENTRDSECVDRIWALLVDIETSLRRLFQNVDLPLNQEKIWKKILLIEAAPFNDMFSIT